MWFSLLESLRECSRVCFVSQIAVASWEAAASEVGDPWNTAFLKLLQEGFVSKYLCMVFANFGGFSVHVYNNIIPPTDRGSRLPQCFGQNLVCHIAQKSTDIEDQEMQQQQCTKCASILLCHCRALQVRATSAAISDRRPSYTKSLIQTSVHLAGSLNDETWR